MTSFRTRPIWMLLGIGLAVGSAALPMPSRAASVVFTVPTSQLLGDAEFGVKAWGPGTVVSRTAGPAGAVDFSFTGLGTSGTGVKDDYPVDPVYGQVIPSHGNGDFSGFTGYGLRIENLDDGPVWVQICMNTGFTGPSGTPPSDITNNTFWTCSPGWRELGPGEEQMVILDFGGAIAYQISDNKVPHSGGGLGWPDGGTYAINEFDRAEVSAIGFEIADFAGTNSAAIIRLTPVAADAGIDGDGAALSANRGNTIALEAYPNPGKAITIRMTPSAGFQSTAGCGSLAVFDAQGRLIKPLWEGPIGPGRLEVHWDGNNVSGAKCAPGMYLLMFDAGSSRSTCAVVIR